MHGRSLRPCEKGGAATGPSPVDRRKPGSKHHLICDGKGTPLHVITTAANVNDITQTLDGIPPVAGRVGAPRQRPEAVLGDKAYDSRAVSRELRKRRIMPVISRKGAPNIKGLASKFRDGPPAESADRFRAVGWGGAGREPECRLGVAPGSTAPGGELLS
ncbi:transposase [Streptomyces coelicoflavus]|uniref:transposase n=1 Tax=Streptomyces coelicoflavus TaxID=285562 RepID=UPI003693C35B